MGAKEVYMKTEEELKKDGWGFHRVKGDKGFVHCEVDSIFGSIRSYCAQNKGLEQYVNELIEGGDRVIVFTHRCYDIIHEANYFHENSWIYKSGKGVVIALSYARNQRGLETMDEILEVAVDETNSNRKEYNNILSQTHVVTDFRFHAVPVTFVSDHVAKGWTVFFHADRLEKGERYVLFAANGKRNIFKPLPFGRGIIERVTNHGLAIIAKSKIDDMCEREYGPCLAHITFTLSPQTEKAPLSMLTKENVLQESVFCPVPFKKEPDVR